MFDPIYSWSIYILLYVYWALEVIGQNRMKTNTVIKFSLLFLLMTAFSL